MDAITLFELNEHLRRVVALNFPQAVWVEAEIAQINLSKGHFYIELLEKEEHTEAVTAVASGILWARTYRRLLGQLGQGLDKVLRQGQAVKLQVRPEFSERYGLKLMVEDVDVEFTLGQMALQRQAVVDKLSQKKLLHKNKQLSLPSVLQRIAIISSPRAAGLQDFLQQLAQNPFGYAFETHLFEAAMQGQRLEEEVVQQIKKINRHSSKYDLVVLIRGGGSRLDLSGFDAYEVGEAIAKCKLPAWTGIGHDIDETVADLVSHQRLKTPTAVASAIVQHNQNFEARIIQRSNAIAQWSQALTFQSKMRLEQLGQQYQYQTKHFLLKEQSLLTSFSERIKNQIPFLFKLEKKKLEHTAGLLELYSIEKTLKRGYAILKKEGKVLKNVASLEENDLLEIKTAEHIIETKIEKLKKG